MGRLLPRYAVVLALGERGSTSRPLQKGISVAVLSLVTYLIVVVLSTPSLKPIDSVTTAIALNWWVLVGLVFGGGVQGYLSAYAKEKGCRIRHTRTVSGGTGLSAALLSFVSFLALVPVGCCGAWIYILSFLPSLLGASLAGFLIERSLELELVSLLAILLFTVYTYLSVRDRIKDTERQRNAPLARSQTETQV